MSEQNYQDKYYFVQLSLNGEVFTVSPPEGNFVQVQLTPEEITFLSFLRGSKIFQIIGKFATAAYQISQKKPEDFSVDKATQLFFQLYKTTAPENQQKLIKWLAMAIEELELKAKDCYAINEHFKTGDRLLNTFVDNQSKSIDEQEDALITGLEKWLEDQVK